MNVRIGSELHAFDYRRTVRRSRSNFFLHGYSWCFGNMREWLKLFLPLSTVLHFLLLQINKRTALMLNQCCKHTGHSFGCDAKNTEDCGDRLSFAFLTRFSRPFIDSPSSVSSDFALLRKHG